MEVIRKIGKGIVIILVITVVIIWMPIGLIGSIFDIPASRRRKKRLDYIAEYKMFPNNKFLYIEYSTGKPLSNWIENELIPKYKQLAVIETWDGEEFEWRKQPWQKIDKKDSSALVLELAADCEGLTTFSVTAIDPTTKHFDLTSQLSVMGPPEDDAYTVFTNNPADEEKQYSEDEVKQMIQRHVEALLATHKFIEIS